MTKNFRCFLKFLGRLKWLGMYTFLQLGWCPVDGAPGQKLVGLWPGIMTSKIWQIPRPFIWVFIDFRSDLLNHRNHGWCILIPVWSFRLISYNLVTAPPVFADGDPFFGLIHPHSTLYVSQTHQEGTKKLIAAESSTYKYDGEFETSS